MAAIVIFLYVRAIRMELRKVDVHMSLPALLDDSAFDVNQPLPQPIEDDDDPELAAYNAYLSGLNERDLQQQ